MFYVYRQNNSGGYFIGPKFVIVQAVSADHADDLASDHGDVYFNGCASGADCSCCGDRWHTQWEDGYESLNDAIDNCKLYAYDPQKHDQILIIEEDESDVIDYTIREQPLLS